MARSAAAFTQPTPPSSSLEFHVDALARQACDDAAQLHEVLQAHACIERLIAPERTSELEGLTVTRSELGALLRLANAELRRSISAVDNSTSQLREALIANEMERKTA